MQSSIDINYRYWYPRQQVLARIPIQNSEKNIRVGSRSVNKDHEWFYYHYSSWPLFFSSTPNALKSESLHILNLYFKLPSLQGSRDPAKRSASSCTGGQSDWRPTRKDGKLASHSARMAAG